MGLILSRSPVIRAHSTTSGIASYEMDLYIYQGTQTTDRADGVFYTLYYETVPNLDGTTNRNAITDLKDYINDFIESTYDGNWASTNSDNEAVWVDFRTRSFDGVSTYSAWSSYTQLYCAEGYGYFEEGNTFSTPYYAVETDTNFAVLITPGTTLYVPDGELLTIPIDRNELNTNYYPYLSDLTNTDTLALAAAPRTESTDLVYYWTEDGLYDYTQVRQDQNAGADIVLNYIKRLTEYKHTPIKIVFKNKYGALQEMWFFGKSTLRTSTSKDGFNRGITKQTGSFPGSINNKVHSKVVFNKMGSEQITLNSGFQVEANNELFRQLFLSEYIWMHYEGDVVPVNVLDSEIQYKTSINDKLINYTINFEFAYNKILA